MGMNKNKEGYPDPTAGAAWGNIVYSKKHYESERINAISRIMPIIKQVAELAGFEVVGRIVLRDKRTGKEYR